MGTGRESSDAFGPAFAAGADGAAGRGAADVDGVRDAYAPRSFVDEGAIETIHQANATFLALVARRGAAPSDRAATASTCAGIGDPPPAGAAAGGPAPGAAAVGVPPFGVAPVIAARIARLDARSRRLAAQCPYTLFNLRLEDAPFWRGVAIEVADHLADERAADAAGASGAPAPPPVRTVLEVAGGDAPVAVFALKAAFLAWHLARNTDGIAAVALGMMPAVMEAWRSLPLSAVDRCAAAALPHLAARWGSNARFWEPLLEAAESPRPDHAERVRLLGLQLLAADGCRHTLPKRSRR